mmetsp:Transcript_64144/g.170491  ORF Transcript_64144/g.170491 Transcript_64144/m.170491 type:complete len:246 (+) Transcript_64144:925-1662(+)
MLEPSGHDPWNILQLARATQHREVSSGWQTEPLHLRSAARYASDVPCAQEKLNSEQLGLSTQHCSRSCSVHSNAMHVALGSSRGARSRQSRVMQCATCPQQESWSSCAQNSPAQSRLSRFVLMTRGGGHVKLTNSAQLAAPVQHNRLSLMCVPQRSVTHSSLRCVCPGTMWRGQACVGISLQVWRGRQHTSSSSCRHTSVAHSTLRASCRRMVPMGQSNSKVEHLARRWQHSWAEHLSPRPLLQM